MRLAPTRRQVGEVEWAAAGTLALVAAAVAWTIALGDHAGSGGSRATPSGLVLDDLAPIVVDVLGPGAEGPFRVSGRSFRDGAELQAFLRGLIQPGERAWVRARGDSSFADVREAVRACARAGCAAVLFDTEGPP